MSSLIHESKLLEEDLRYWRDYTTIGLTCVILVLKYFSCFIRKIAAISLFEQILVCYMYYTITNLEQRV